MSASAIASSFLGSGKSPAQGRTLAGLAASYLGVSARDAQATQTPTPARKVARFISAEAAKSKLELADGKLPELHLREGTKKDKKETEVKSKTVNPLVMFAALSLSVVFSIVLVMVDFSPPNRSGLERKRSARVQIKEYFTDQEMRVNPDAELKPHQVLLREAHQAHSRGDTNKARECYRKVLNLLHAERATFDKGVTGSPEEDKKLEKLINILLQ